MIRIRIRLFAHMAQQAGTPSFSLEIPAGSKVSAVRGLVERQFPDVRWAEATMLAVNQQYVPAEHSLQDNDEVAIIPPVSGG